MERSWHSGAPACGVEAERGRFEPQGSAGTSNELRRSSVTNSLTRRDRVFAYGMDSADRSSVLPSEPSSSIVNLNAGRACPPHVRPATSHHKCGWKVVTANSTWDGNRSSQILRFEGSTASSTLSGSMFARQTTSARLLEHLAVTNISSNWPTVRLRIRKGPWRAWELSSGQYAGG